MTGATSTPSPGNEPARTLRLAKRFQPAHLREQVLRLPRTGWPHAGRAARLDPKNPQRQVKLCRQGSVAPRHPLVRRETGRARTVTMSAKWSHCKPSWVSPASARYRALVHEAYVTWLSLAQPWQQAFEAAWTSWRSGSGAVGAAITNSEGAVVAVGQNRMLDLPGGSGPLARTLMAHAEMNALAGLAPGEYSGYTIYTTYEPCFMCAATIIGTYHIPKVAFAAYDPSWEGLLDAFGQHPAIARWLPEREHLGGPYGALAYVLHLTWILRHLPGPREAHQHFALPTWRSRGTSWSKTRSSTWRRMVRAPPTWLVHSGPTCAGCRAPVPDRRSSPSPCQRHPSARWSLLPGCAGAPRDRTRRRPRGKLD
jgi:tRNA(Arg) A34 adenosine deaminase TadA